MTSHRPLVFLMVGILLGLGGGLALGAQRAQPSVASASASGLPPLTAVDRHGHAYRVVDLGRPDVSPKDPCPRAWHLEFDNLSSQPFEWVCWDTGYHELDRVVNPALNGAYEAAAGATNQSDCETRFPGFVWTVALVAGGQYCRPGFDRGPTPS